MRVFWTQKKIKRISIAFLGILLLALPILYLFSDDERQIVRLGDFLAFYTAGVMVHDGLGDSLYDWNLQKQIQDRYFPVETVPEFPFCYPPYVAVFFYPFSIFSPHVAKYLFVLLMAGCLIGAVKAAQFYIPALKGHVLETTALLLAICPVYMGILGAQNVAWSMLLFSLVIGYFSKGSRAGDFLCGIWLGLWLFKPHYAFMLLIFFMAARRGMVVLGFMAVGLVYYLIGALVSGFAWPITWLRATRDFSILNRLFEDNYQVNFLSSGLTQWLTQFRFLGEGQEFIMGILMQSLSIGLFLWLLFQFIRISFRPDQDQQRILMLDLLALAGPVLILTAPYSHFYDIGIFLLPCARYLKFPRDQDISRLLAVILLVNLLTLSKKYFPFQPLIVVPIGVFFFMAKRISLLKVKSAGASLA